MKKSQKEEQTRLDEHSVDTVAESDGIHSRLSHLTEVNALPIDVAFTFSLMFAEIFTRDTPNYEITPGIFGATRSNWTYHTAMAISQACKMLNLTCRFETLGKRDAVIETREDKPTVILIAEWEWDYEDIFGQGKELDKLTSPVNLLQQLRHSYLFTVPSQSIPPTSSELPRIGLAP